MHWVVFLAAFSKTVWVYEPLTTSMPCSVWCSPLLLSHYCHNWSFPAPIFFVQEGPHPGSYLLLVSSDISTSFLPPNMTIISSCPAWPFWWGGSKVQACWCRGCVIPAWFSFSYNFLPQWLQAIYLRSGNSLQKLSFLFSWPHPLPIYHVLHLD